LCPHDWASIMLAVVKQPVAVSLAPPWLSAKVGVVELQRLIFVPLVLAAMGDSNKTFSIINRKKSNYQFLAF